MLYRLRSYSPTSTFDQAVWLLVISALNESGSFQAASWKEKQPDTEPMHPPCFVMSKAPVWEEGLAEALWILAAVDDPNAKSCWLCLSVSFLPQRSDSMGLTAKAIISVHAAVSLLCLMCGEALSDYCLIPMTVLRFQDCAAVLIERRWQDGLGCAFRVFSTENAENF